jgi:imidazolonepropionase-like amidohydrolase
VEPGKLADFVILDANPLDNISNVRRVHRVVKGGVVYDPEQLLKPLFGKVD